MSASIERGKRGHILYYLRVVKELHKYYLHQLFLVKGNPHFIYNLFKCLVLQFYSKRGKDNWCLMLFYCLPHGRIKPFSGSLKCAQASGHILRKQGHMWWTHSAWNRKSMYQVFEKGFHSSSIRLNPETGFSEWEGKRAEEGYPKCIYISQTLQITQMRFMNMHH